MCKVYIEADVTMADVDKLNIDSIIQRLLEGGWVAEGEAVAGYINRAGRS